MGIQSYNFDRLERISRSEMALRETLEHFVPGEEQRFQLLLRLEQCLQQAIRGGCTLHTRNYRLEDAPRWEQRLGEGAIYVTLSTLPSAPKMLLVWDSILALSLIDRLLGGELNEVPTPRPLTEIETGVFSYLLMQVCRTFHRFFEQGAEAVPIRVEAIFSDTEQVRAAIAGAERVALADVTVAIPELTGQLQLVLPDPFVAEVLAPRVTVPEERVTPIEQRERMKNLGDLNFPMRAVLGEATLSPLELNGLQAGDVVLLDQSHSRLEAGQLRGRVVFEALRSGAPTVVTEIAEAGPPARFVVQEFYHEA